YQPVFFFPRARVIRSSRFVSSLALDSLQSCELRLRSTTCVHRFPIKLVCPPRKTVGSDKSFNGSIVKMREFPSIAVARGFAAALVLVSVLTSRAYAVELGCAANGHTPEFEKNYGGQLDKNQAWL